MVEHSMAPHQKGKKRQQRRKSVPHVRWTIFLVLLFLAGFLAARGMVSQARPGLGDAGPWELQLVNRQHPIPEGYTVTLREMPGGEQVDERIYGPLTEMLEAAREGNEGEAPRVISGYRTQEVQQGFFDDKVWQYQNDGYSEEEAKAEAGRWVALPGHSEHQLGLAVDLEGETYDVFSWLQENSYQYGFIFRYPGDKTDITGTAEEVWHYRYVGKEAAAEMFEQGLCLEEYVENRRG